jgi:hypothetical protein
MTERGEYLPTPEGSDSGHEAAHNALRLRLAEAMWVHEEGAGWDMTTETQDGYLALADVVIATLVASGYRLLTPEQARRNAAIHLAAGDLENELENLREHWEGTERAPLIENYLYIYERAEGTA